MVKVNLSAKIYLFENLRFSYFSKKTYVVDIR